MTERNPIPPCLSHLEQLLRPAMLRAWHAAKDSCLLPPDGGSPTVGECNVSARAANAIREMIPDAKLPVLEIASAAPLRLDRTRASAVIRAYYRLEITQARALECLQQWSLGEIFTLPGELR